MSKNVEDDDERVEQVGQEGAIYLGSGHRTN